MSNFYIKKLTIIGVGLIGGSIACSLKKNNLVGHITGYSNNKKELKQALDIGIIDSYSLDVKEAIKNTNVIVIAVPVGGILNLLQKIKPYIRSDIIITDVSSVKLYIIDCFKKVFLDVPPLFVPAHPLAGGEISGLSKIDGNLFNKKKVIITPHKNIDNNALDFITNLWHCLGANVQIMQSEMHDKLLSMTSHLPHILAFSLMDYLISSENSNVFDYAASGFKDFSRIASSDAIMWRDICFANKKELLQQISNYKNTLDNIYNIIDNSKSKQLENVFIRSKKVRDKWLRQYE